MRPHYFRSIRSGIGALRVGATVALLEPGTDTPLAAAVYATGAGGSTRGSTWTSEDGMVDFYLDDAAVVDILVTPSGGETPRRFLNQWVGDPSNPAAIE
jgi:hypothetical protein